MDQYSKDSKDLKVSTSVNLYQSSNNPLSIQSSVSPSKTYINPVKSTGKPQQQALEDYKKLCLKTYSAPNGNFVSILKNDILGIYVDGYNLKEINVINKIIGAYHYFKQIIFAPADPKSNVKETKKKRGFNIVTPLTPSEQYKAEKDKKEKLVEKNTILYTIVQGISKNLCMSKAVVSFQIHEINLKIELAEFLSQGIIENKTLKSLNVNNCILPLNSYEILLKGLFTHEILEYLDLSGNELSDKHGNMIGRIISRQTQRRDQVIWMYGLRNEKPITNDYTKGLISINLSNNKLSDISADDISNSLSYDAYIRSVNLNQNEFSYDGCKKFIKILRKNVTILNLDLTNNPGYEQDIHYRLIMKLCKNIKFLHRQKKKDFFSQNEFNFLLQFINQEFFNIEIPPEIIDNYNQRSEIDDVNEDDLAVVDNKPERNTLNERRKLNKEKEKPEEKKTQEFNKQDSGADDEHENDNDNENENENNISENNQEKEGEKEILFNQSNSQKTSMNDAQILKEKYKMLYSENQQLRKEILTLKMDVIKNKKTVSSEPQKNVEEHDKSVKEIF